MVGDDSIQRQTPTAMPWIVELTREATTSRRDLRTMAKPRTTRSLQIMHPASGSRIIMAVPSATRGRSTDRQRGREVHATLFRSIRPSCAIAATSITPTPAAAAPPSRAKASATIVQAERARRRKSKARLSKALPARLTEGVRARAEVALRLLLLLGHLHPRVEAAAVERSRVAAVVEALRAVAADPMVVGSGLVGAAS